MLYVIRIHYKKRDLPKAEALFWTLVLLIVGILVMVEDTANLIRSLFSVTRLTDVIVIFSLMGVFALLIENRIQINVLRHKLETIVRSRALQRKVL